MMPGMMAWSVSPAVSEMPNLFVKMVATFSTVLMRCPTFGHSLVNHGGGVFCVSQKSLIDLAMSVSWLTAGGLTRYALAPRR